MSASAGERWMHGHTYSGHPTCCAVTLENMEITKRDDLSGNAARMGGRLIDSLRRLQDEIGCIGNVRGLGLM